MRGLQSGRRKETVLALRTGIKEERTTKIRRFWMLIGPRGLVSTVEVLLPALVALTCLTLSSGFYLPRTAGRG